ncbi:MAG TPA: FAD:protein FMN transferase [Verrucomicrobiae bacterium]|nr:FAD:protein FMN transferase [Verrucomicrobiae bacterium]
MTAPQRPPAASRAAAKLALAALLCVHLLPAAHPLTASPLQRFEYEHLQMATWFRLVIYAPERGIADRAATAAFARVDALNAAMSDFLPDSEVSRLTAPEHVKTAVPISEDLCRVFRCARPIEQNSGGALDLTAGPLTQLWRRARERGVPPDPDAIREARRAVGYELLILDLTRSSATPSIPGMRLDLGAVAKGYAADCALAECRRRGLTRVLANAGGEVVVGEPPPDQQGWLVGLPAPGAKDPPDECLVVANSAVSTSGDQNQFLAYGGERYSHVIDPRTGNAVAHGCTVTVVVSNTDSDGLIADALATAVNALGPEHGPALLARFGPAGARIIRPSPNGPTTITTPEFRRWRVVPRQPNPPDQMGSAMTNPAR